MVFRRQNKEGRPINLRKPKADCKTFQIFVLKNFLDIYFSITSQPLYKVQLQRFIEDIGLKKVNQVWCLSTLPGNKVFFKVIE